MNSRLALVLLISFVASPANAAWHATTPQAREAAKVPQIAAALAATERFDKAILAKDEAVFSSLFAEDAVVNNPFNKIALKKDAINNLRTGLINYTSLERSLEYAVVRGPHEVLLMGEEALTPVGKAKFANKRVKRRTTEIWTDVSGSWKLAVRQATIYSAE